MLQPSIETMPRPALEALQLQRLRAASAHAHEAVPAYRTKCEQAGMAPADVRTLADLRRALR